MKQELNANDSSFSVFSFEAGSRCVGMAGAYHFQVIDCTDILTMLAPAQCLTGPECPEAYYPRPGANVQRNVVGLLANHGFIDAVRTPGVDYKYSLEGRLNYIASIAPPMLAISFRTFSEPKRKATSLPSLTVAWD